MTFEIGWRLTAVLLIAIVYLHLMFREWIKAWLSTYESEQTVEVDVPLPDVVAHVIQKPDREQTVDSDALDVLQKRAGLRE